jgi:hypothetical protein
MIVKRCVRRSSSAVARDRGLRTIAAREPCAFRVRTATVSGAQRTPFRAHRAVARP